MAADEQKRGRVYVAAMNMRGARAVAPGGCVSLNVTSAQRIGHPDRLAFSPMTPVADPATNAGYWNFESRWQAGKKWRGVPHETSIAWWRAQQAAKRRYPNSKRMTCEYSSWPDVADGEPLDRATARKLMYVPLYCELTAARPA